MKMLIGQKLGMTRIFDNNDKAIAVSIIKVDPNIIIFIKSKEKDGFDALQIGYGAIKHVTKPILGHIKKAALKSIKVCKEFKISENDVKSYKIGQYLTPEIFKVGEVVDINGISKGKGFAGVMKRHGFKGMPASHGHEKQRTPGSIGCRFPQHTIKGKRMAGHMGGSNITIKCLKIIDIDPKNNLIAIKGAIPGAIKSIVYIKGKSR